MLPACEVDYSNQLLSSHGIFPVCLRPNVSLKKITVGWGFSLVVEHLPKLGSVLNSIGKKKKIAVIGLRST